MQDFQNHQTIAGFFTWDLPFLRGNDSALGKILGGWSLTANGYWNFASKGYTRGVNYDANANNWGDDFAKVVGDISYPKTEITGQGDLLYQWIDPSAFVYPNGTLDRTFSSAHDDGRPERHRPAALGVARGRGPDEGLPDRGGHASCSSGWRSSTCSTTRT